MTPKDTNAMQKAWQDWHNDWPEDDIPAVNLSFEKGFKAALEYQEKARGEHQDEKQIKRLQRGHDRYEKLRKINPRDFMALWNRALHGERFDTLVDRIKQ
jgi:hypothetical protein